MTEARAAAHCRVFAAVLGALLAVWVSIGLWRGGVDLAGAPLGPDFAPYWTAAKLAPRGALWAVYDPATHFAAERAFFGPAMLAGPTPFFYPPTFLVVLAPFAALPYLPALLGWTCLTAGAYWIALRGTLRGIGPPWVALAFPATAINVANGQNGLLSAALLASGALLLDRRPFLGGVCLGCLAYKPHLLILAPFAIIAWRIWPALIGAAAACAALVSISIGAFGLDAWRCFFAASRIARGLLESGEAGPERMASVFAAAQLWGAGLSLAYAMQAIAALCAAGGLWMLRDALAPGARGAALAAAAPLASPYLFDYDLAVLAAPMAWLLREAVVSRSSRTGKEIFLPWEKSVLCAAFVAPMIARVAAIHLSLPVAPFVSTALFVCVIRRARNSAGFPEQDAAGSALPTMSFAKCS